MADATLEVLQEISNPYETVDESNIDVDPAVLEVVAGAIDEITNYMSNNATPQPPPPIVTQVEVVNYQTCREKLREFFSKRFVDIPRAGDDTEFDKLLEELGITNNRRYCKGRPHLLFSCGRSVKIYDWVERYFGRSDTEYN
jgi:hypothetical protein